MNSLINPYDLLGVSINTRIDELKKRYYELAILMHPDKGGDKDDMITLQTAYKFILREIENIDYSSNVEDLTTNLQNEYKKFCKSQENTLPEFNDIFAEAFNLDKFNDYFSNTQVTQTIPVSIPEGYGDLMDISEEHQVHQSYEPSTQYHDAEIPIKNQFTLAEYVPHIKEQSVYGNLYDYQNPTTNNFTTNTNGMVLSDYKEAFSEPAKVPYDPEYKNEYHADNLDELMIEREQELRNVGVSTNTSSIWSYEGFIDSSRNIIKNLFLKN